MLREQIKEIKDIVFNELGYRTRLGKVDQELKHVQMTFEDKNGYIIAYMEIAIMKEGINIFGGQILDLPCRFVRIFELIKTIKFEDK